MSKSFLKNILPEILGAIIVIGYLLSPANLAGDPGVGWHLKAGQLMSESGSILYNDPFLFSGEGKEWINNQWLSDILLWKIYQSAGWLGLELLVVGIGLIVILIVLPLAGRSGETSFGGWFIASFLSFLLIWFHLIVRPVAFTILFFAIEYSFLRRLLTISVLTREVKWGLLCFLPILFLFWSNLHPGFAIGLILLICAWIAVEWDRNKNPNRQNGCAYYFRLSVAICFLVTLINPFFYKVHLAVFDLLNSPYFMKLNLEWQQPRFLEPIFLPYTLTIIILLIGLAANKYRNISLFDGLNLLAFGVLSLGSARYLPYFGTVALIPLAKFLSSKGGVVSRHTDLFTKTTSSKGRSGYLMTAIYLGLAVMFLTSPNLLKKINRAKILGPVNPESEQAITKLKTIILTRNFNRPMRIFNNPDLGGLITMYLWPAASAFIDDRNELNGESRYQTFFKINDAKEDWSKELSTLNVDYVVLLRDAPVFRKLSSESSWALIISNSTVGIFQRMDASEQSSVLKEDNIK